MWLPYAIGAVGGCAALVWAARAPAVAPSAGPGRLLERLGKASLGLYILHPVIVAPVELAARGRGGVWLAAVIALATVAIGLPLVEYLRRIPGLRRAI